MYDILNSHVDYIAASDPEFDRAWQIHQARCAPILSRLSHKERELHGSSISWSHTHVLAACGGARIFAGIPDFEFRGFPRPRVWIAHWLPAKATNLFGYWHWRLVRCLRYSAPGPYVLYGGLKSWAGIRHRIEQWRGGAPFDLWDGVRFRIVVDGIRDVADLTMLLLSQFREHIVRCRNYYARPRNGPTDPYRAIHIELQSDAEDFVEVQIVSSRREAVGLIDHSMVLKRRVPFTGPAHQAWLERLSWTSNLLDWSHAAGVTIERLSDRIREDVKKRKPRGFREARR
jgi:hypothetical protein